MPDCISAMKKLTAKRGQRRDGEGRDVIKMLKVMLPSEWSLLRRKLAANCAGTDGNLT
jgi:hypothetical protein